MRRTVLGGCAAAWLAALALCTSDHRPSTIGSDGRDYTRYDSSASAFEPQAGVPGGCAYLPLDVEPGSFNPYSDGAVEQVSSLLFEPLARVDAVTGDLVPVLAAAWTWSADSAELTVTMRPGVRWSDSTPVGARDVVFTYGTFAEGVGDGAVRGVCGDSIAVVAADSMTVTFTSPGRCPLLPRLLRAPVFPAHVGEFYRRASRIDYAMRVGAPLDSVVCSGPFVVAGHVPTQRVLLTRNPRYWRSGAGIAPLPYLDSVSLELVPDENTKQVRFRRGDLDYFLARGQDYEGLAEDSTGRYAVHCLGPSATQSVLVFNLGPNAPDSSGSTDSMRPSWVGDSRVRCALALAVNRHRVVDSAAGGAGFVVVSLLNAESGAHAVAFDTLEARRLLEQAGLRDSDGDGTREWQGRDAALVMLVATGNVVRVAAAQLVCDDFARVGVKATVRLREFDRLQRTLLSPDSSWGAALVGLHLPPNPVDAWNVWHSGGSLHLWNTSGTAAYAWETAIDSALAALAVGKGQAGSTRLSEVLAAEMPMAPLYAPERLVCITRRFGNLNPTLRAGVLHNLDELFVRPVSREAVQQTLTGASSSAN